MRLFSYAITTSTNIKLEYKFHTFEQTLHTFEHTSNNFTHCNQNDSLMKITMVVFIKTVNDATYAYRALANQANKHH